MRMTYLFSADRVTSQFKARSDASVLRRLARQISRDAGLPIKAIEASLNCSELSAHPLGRNVVLLHTPMPGLAKPIAACATLVSPLRFGAKEPIVADVVILLLSPDEAGSQHLQALARIARRLRAPMVPDFLRDASSPEAIYALLAADEHDGKLAPMNPTPISRISRAANEGQRQSLLMPIGD